MDMTAIALALTGLSSWGIVIFTAGLAAGIW